MSSGGSSSPVVTQTQQSAPWAGAQPFLQQLYTTGQEYFQNNIGYTPYAGPVQAPLDPTLSQALTAQQNIATPNIATGTPGYQAANALSTGVMGSQGITPGVQQGLGYLTDVANQAQGQQNPYLQDIIAQQMNQVQSAASGAGRYGSGDYNAAIARAIAPTLGQDYEARQARLQSAGQNIADIYAKGLQQAGQYAQLQPSIDQMQYQPAQTLADVGQFMQGRAQTDLAGQIALYNAQQAYPWQSLERYAAMLAGAGQLGGSQVSTQQTQVPLAQRLLGGTLAGAGIGSVIPGIGTGLGAVGGGLLGLF